MRFFNTTGPIDPKDHYALTPLDRLDWENLSLLIDQKRYFVLHAPRQTGKTSALLALMQRLNQEGRYRCCYANIEMAQAAREDVYEAMRAILSSIANAAHVYLHDDSFMSIWQEQLAQLGHHAALHTGLSIWAERSDKPIVLLIDEVDALIGDTLISLLRQLRAGYTQRPTHFPSTIILCGVRDVRDYRIHSTQNQEIITGGSAFNIKAESLRLANFNEAEMCELLLQHTAETGQQFDQDALTRFWQLTSGQPWLVNALAYEACFRPPYSKDRTLNITLERVEEVKEQLILRRDTHLDQLADKLSEERVRRVIEPILASESGDSEAFDPQDVSYVHDLGLISVAVNGRIEIANEIYREIIPRELSYGSQLRLTQETAWYQRADGLLNMTKLLDAFQVFFREHSEHWLERFQYKEAGPQLLLQAFLQRIVNGGGRIEREYGLGRKRTDLLVIWNEQRIVLELKILHKSLEKTLAEGLTQTTDYMDRAGTREGHLILFDRSSKPWEEKLFQREIQHNDYTIQVWGM